MPKMSEPGKQIKVWLPNHVLAALQQDAKDNGESKVQPVVRHILGAHYCRQAEAAGLDIQIERQVSPAG